MSFMDCIDRALAKERITGKRRDEARERYENLYQAAIADGMSPPEAEDHAAKLATQQVAADIAQRKASTYKQLAWSIDDWRQWQSGGAAHIGRDAGSVIEGTVGSTPGRISLNDYTTTAEGRIKAFLGDMIDKYSPKLVGLVYPKAGLENIVRELFKPGSTGDEMAAALAKSWIKATDYGVMLYQRAGGVLNHLEEWRLPQRQNRVKMFKAGADAWVNDHLAWLDWNKMQFADGSPINPADRARVLSEVYKTMKTGGDINIKPGQYRGFGGGGLDDHRFLIYKNADSWLAAHAKYGDGSVYDTMMQHVETMARRIGIAQAFGPKPELGLEQMISNMRRVAADADSAATAPPKNALGIPTTYRDEAAKAENFLRDAFQVKVKGMNAPENGSASIAAGLLAGSREVIMSATLGSVYLYQGTQDFFTAALRYRLAGLPVMKSVGTYLKMFSGVDKDLPRTLQRAGFINLAQSRIAHSYTRLTGLEPQGSRFTQRLADTVMRASLTEWHAASARFTTAAEFTGALADWAHLSFDQLPGKAVFEAHGITAADWDAMRSTPIHNVSGHAFLFPDDHIAANGNSEGAFHTADKFMSMINQEAKLATIETQVAAQLALKGTTRPGTLVGEIIRSAAMFKNFPLTVFNTHIRQGLIQDTIPGKVGYIAQVLLGMTLFGAVGTILHDVAAGKDPQSMFDQKHVISPEFWTRAALAGGGFGILGDYVAGNLEHGRTLGETVSGPLVAAGSDAINLAGEAAKAVAGEKNHFAREAAKFGSRWAPGSTIWYLRAPLRALVWDNLLKATDPDAAEVFRRRAEWTQKSTGQSYWWGPGQAAPDHAPDLRALVQRR
ncbi:hypothetical protein [Mesorhizobium sp.]|uniref:hypothetical protein n=1 Tax=Mesorhizobium sp. TaxID=1871066 RepID=UPI000FE47FFA|nr:hypothetical protein [Mesorhizobium sp.]RWD70207.1 MAG: hypothetical protein EOS37_15505 [Mesorhizobium sp.]